MSTNPTIADYFTIDDLLSDLGFEMSPEKRMEFERERHVPLCTPICCPGHRIIWVDAKPLPANDSGQLDRLKSRRGVAEFDKLPEGYQLSRPHLFMDRAISFAGFDPIEARLVRYIRENMRPDHWENEVINSVRVDVVALARLWRVEPAQISAAMAALIRDCVLDEPRHGMTGLMYPQAWKASRLAREDLQLAAKGENLSR